MKHTLHLLILLLSLTVGMACGVERSSVNIAEANEAQPVAGGDEVSELFRRYNDPKHAGMLQSAMWTLTHDYKDSKRVDEVLQTFAKFMDGFQKHVAGNAAPLESLGGVKAFREKLRSWLGDSDQSVRAFAAVAMGISGDRENIPHLVTILKRKDVEDELSRIYDKGRVAVALGLLGAAEHKPDIVLLLKSKNSYDRSGAIHALSLLGAKENAKEVAAMLSDPDRFPDDPSPVNFLVETRTANSYKKELIAAMQRPFGRDTAKAAMYALVKIKAKENAADIAKLLTDQFMKGDAAKALALLGASEYTDQIGLLLDDSKDQSQADAALALGILGAKKYAPKLAMIMEKKDGFANSYAAAGLVMMDSPEQAARAAKYVAAFRAQGVNVTADSFHPLISDEVAPYLQKLKSAK